MMRLMILLVLISCVAQAEIYKSQNEEGEWIYTDKPSPNAERMKLPPLSTYSPPPVGSGTASGKQAESGDVYKSIRFIAPEQDATIRDNTGIVKAVIKLKPPLKSSQGHKIQFYLDGDRQGKPVAGSTMTLTNIERGSHTLGAHVRGVKDEVLIRAEPVSFYIHKQSISNPSRVVSPKPKPKPAKAR